MIYAQLTVFSMFSAYITANDEVGFRDMFREVVGDCVNQYEHEFGEIESKWTNRIKTDMAELQPILVNVLEGFSYDLRIDGNGHVGKVTVDEVFLSRDSVEVSFQEIIDDLNQDIVEVGEKWAVFESGFFPLNQGYEIDELFK